MWWILPAALLAVVIFLLVCPWRLTAAGRIHQGISGGGSVVWLWGLLEITFETGAPSPVIRMGPWRSQPTGDKQPEREKTKRQKQTDAKNAKEKKNEKGTVRDYLELLKGPVRGRIFRYISDMARALDLSLGLRGRYYIADPAWTGMAAGLIGILDRGRNKINLAPDFVTRETDMEGELACRIILGQLLGLTLIMALTEPVRPVLWSIVKKR